MERWSSPKDRRLSGNKHLSLFPINLYGFPSFYFIYWCGDSRIYLFRDGRLRQLTIDHTYTLGLVDQGKLRPEQVKQHPDNNIITRAVGAGRQLFVDMDLRNL